MTAFVEIPSVPVPIPGQPGHAGFPSIPEPTTFPIVASFLLVAAAVAWRRRR